MALSEVVGYLGKLRENPSLENYLTVANAYVALGRESKHIALEIAQAFAGYINGLSKPELIDFSRQVMSKSHFIIDENKSPIGKMMGFFNKLQRQEIILGETNVAGEWEDLHAALNSLKGSPLTGRISVRNFLGSDGEVLNSTVADLEEFVQDTFARGEPHILRRAESNVGFLTTLFIQELYQRRFGDESLLLINLPGGVAAWSERASYYEIAKYYSMARDEELRVDPLAMESLALIANTNAPFSYVGRGIQIELITEFTMDDRDVPVGMVNIYKDRQGRIRVGNCALPGIDLDKLSKEARGFWGEVKNKLDRIEPSCDDLVFGQGFELDKSLGEQSPELLAWVREAFGDIRLDSGDLPDGMDIWKGWVEDVRPIDILRMQSELMKGKWPDDPEDMAVIFGRLAGEIDALEQRGDIGGAMKFAVDVAMLLARIGIIGNFWHSHHSSYGSYDLDLFIREAFKSFGDRLGYVRAAVWNSGQNNELRKQALSALVGLGVVVTISRTVDEYEYVFAERGSVWQKAVEIGMNNGLKVGRGEVNWPWGWTINYKILENVKKTLSDKNHMLVWAWPEVFERLIDSKIGTICQLETHTQGNEFGSLSLPGGIICIHKTDESISRSELRDILLKALAGEVSPDVFKTLHPEGKSLLKRMEFYWFENLFDIYHRGDTLLKAGIVADIWNNLIPSEERFGYTSYNLEGWVPKLLKNLEIQSQNRVGGVDEKWVPKCAFVNEIGLKDIFVYGDEDGTTKLILSWEACELELVWNGNRWVDMNGYFLNASDYDQGRINKLLFLIFGKGVEGEQAEEVGPQQVTITQYENLGFRLHAVGTRIGETRNISQETIRHFEEKTGLVLKELQDRVNQLLNGQIVPISKNNKECTFLCDERLIFLSKHVADWVFEFARRFLAQKHKATFGGVSTNEFSDRWINDPIIRENVRKYMEDKFVHLQPTNHRQKTKRKDEVLEVVESK